MNIIRTDAENKDFISLVALLDEDLAKRDGDEHAFYHQFNNVNTLKHVVLVSNKGEVACCGAIKEIEEGVVEVKRMYTKPNNRGKGLASLALLELEKWASEMNYEKCVLETGDKQPEALALYKKNGYKVIPNYGQYSGVKNSICFEKRLS